MRVKNAGILIIFVVFIALAAFCIFGPLSSQHSAQSNNSRPLLPLDVTNQIDSIRLDNSTYFSRWEANETEHVVTVYLNCNPPKNRIQENVIDNWTIRWALNPDINETFLNGYKGYLSQWVKAHPEQPFGYDHANACTRTVYVSLFNITPETEGSEVMVSGWRLIFVRAT